MASKGLHTIMAVWFSEAEKHAVLLFKENTAPICSVGLIAYAYFLYSPLFSCCLPGAMGGVYL